MLRRPQRECQDAEGGGLVGAIEKDAGVAYVQVRYIVRLTKAIRHRILGIISHPARPRLVQAPAGHLRRLACGLELATRRATLSAEFSHRRGLWAQKWAQSKN